MRTHAPFTALLAVAAGAMALPLASQASPAAHPAQAGDADSRIPFTQRAAAAEATATQSASCKRAQPFYWEIGNGERALAHGKAGDNAPDEHTSMAIASASKWIYGAYVAERRNGQLTDEDIQFLSFKSGYTRFRMCLKRQTVEKCQTSLLNGLGRIDPSTQGYFDYNGGHMQKHAVLMGLGDLNDDGLASAIRIGLRPLGPDWSISYMQPQLAGGAVTTASDYARFLRGIVTGDLKMNALLGTDAVCTNPATCPKDAVKTPIPGSETWHYAIGHWVEDDPQVGDGSFSSPGAFGFYPWIDAGKRFYGILAREDRQNARSGEPDDKPGVQSVDCGRSIRKAWMDGVAQP